MEQIRLEQYDSTAKQHGRNPRHMGAPDTFDGHAKITGPCGDTMEFWLCVDQNKIQKVSFITDGCASSRACGSMTACLAESKTIKEAQNITSKHILDALDNLPRDHWHCALLSANTLSAACDDYLLKQHTQGGNKIGK